MKLFDPLKTNRELWPPQAEPETAKAEDPTEAKPSKAQVFRGIPDSDDPLKRDFRLFLILVWRFLGLPDPTPLQLSMAWYLQHGPDRSIIMAFRGCAKSWITAAYCLWVFYCDPQKKIMVASGSLKRSVAFTQFCLTLLREMPLLQHLAPRPDQRQSSTAFDICGVTPDQNPSLHAVGVLAQLAGYRADIIIPDDVETATNSLTVVMREKLAEAVFEFEAILKPGGSIRYLGTPHADDSLYLKLAKDRAYFIRIWCVRFPNREQLRRYGDKIAPYITHQLAKNPKLVGTSTEPTRFDEEELQKREIGITSAEFALQYMLDTTLADANKYPLKLRNLMVLGLDPRRGPDSMTWGVGEELVLKELPNLGFDGDFFHRPAMTSETSSPWGEIVGFVDTAGKATDNSDETSVTIVAELNGMLGVLYNGAWLDGFAPGTLRGIAKAFVKWNCGKAFVETNFGDGMFLSLLQPYVEAEWLAANKERRKDEHGGTSLEETRAVMVQKEHRILSVLEPLTAQHRLVVNREVIEEDYRGIKKLEGEETRHRYALFYQYTHLTREKDALAHDDRLDSLSGACAYFAPMLGVNPLGMAKKREEERIDEELEELFRDADDVATAGRRRAGSSPFGRLKAVLGRALGSRH